jgi:hypothetical protein
VQRIYFTRAVHSALTSAVLAIVRNSFYLATYPPLSVAHFSSVAPFFAFLWLFFLLTVGSSKLPLRACFDVLHAIASGTVSNRHRPGAISHDQAVAFARQNVLVACGVCSLYLRSVLLSV